MSAAPVAFFDGIGTAHSLPLVAGLDQAAACAGIRRRWTTAIRPPAAGEDGCDWLPTRAFYAEFCDGGTVSPRAYRAACAAALRDAATEGCTFYCDLAVEQLLASHGGPLHVELPAVWVVHQVVWPPDRRPLATRAKVLAAHPGKWGARARNLHARRLLAALARSGGRFVVHSVAARDRLARVVAGDRIHVAHWPIASREQPPAPATGTPGERVAVFPGEARPGKGLDVLIDALPDIGELDALDLPTVVTSDAQALVRRGGDRRVRMGTAWLSNDGYRAHLRAATLAVLPYRTAATANAGISASLLDVLAVGLPAVVTRPIAGALPDGYGGAVVVEPDSPRALAAGVDAALADIDALTSRARAEGPAFVMRHHTYEQYLDVIVEAGTA